MARYVPGRLVEQHRFRPPFSFLDDRSNSAYGETGAPACFPRQHPHMETTIFVLHQRHRAFVDPLSIEVVCSLHSSLSL